MAEKLKPCPFCGGEAELVNIDAAGVQGIPDPVTVCCKECKCSTNWFSKEWEAIDAWNSRASDGTIDIAMLETKLRKYADKKCYDGEIELANGILKAVSFIKEEFKEDKQ